MLRSYAQREKVWRVKPGKRKKQLPIVILTISISGNFRHLLGVKCFEVLYIELQTNRDQQIGSLIEKWNGPGDVH